VVSDRRRALILAAACALLVVVLLIGGGLYVRTLIAQSFRTATSLGATRALAYDTLRYMLDEQTGVRGFAATQNPVFLEPYHNALPAFATALRKLKTSIARFDLPEANAAVNNLAIGNSEYLRTVATPLLGDGGKNTNSIESRGKDIVDRFRDNVATIDTLLAQREEIVDAAAQTAIDRIGLLIGGAVAVVLLLLILYAIQQAAISARLERVRTRALEQRHEANVLRAAYATEKRIADTLQEAFVQRPLPTHSTFRLSATYAPASEETKVGGDWYDALELPGNRVLFAIGDVTGHGIGAAVTMNRVRQALISSALLDPMPAALLGRVAQELYAAQAPLVTAVAGYADANTYEFIYAIAGHPPPILLEPGRPPRTLECGSLPLGALPDNEYRTVHIQSVPGAMLVLYTDGAIEHSRDVLEGETILLAAVAEAARRGPLDPATFIHNTVFSSREIGDDVAILTVGFAVAPVRSNEERLLGIGRR
jgi:serine phosphatase RsbU (regulator of sigma subunit)